MIHVHLRDLFGDELETVTIPDAAPGDEPELLAWGARFFVAARPGIYREVRCLQVYTERERAAMERGGS